MTPALTARPPPSILTTPTLVLTRTQACVPTVRDPHRPHREALPLQRANANARGEATVLSGLGVLYLSMGQPAQALENLTPALALYQADHDLRDEAYTLTSIGEATGDDRKVNRYPAMPEKLQQPVQR